MFEQFWLEESQLAPNSGYSLFGITHLIFIGLIILIIIFMCRYFSRLPKNKQASCLKVIAWLTLIIEIVKDCYLAYLGKFTVGYWPIHLCGLGIFLNLAHAYSGNKILGEVSFALIMPGAVSAILFPNWLAYPAISYYNFHCYLAHTLLVLYALLAFRGGIIKPKISNHWMITLFLAIVAPLVYVFNLYNGTNFLFINYPEPGSPLELLGKWFGNPGYLIPFALLAFLVTFSLEFIGQKIDSRHGL